MDIGRHERVMAGEAFGELAEGGAVDDAGFRGGTFLGRFLEHCLRGTNYATGQTGTPLDFLSFHAKGAPKRGTVLIILSPVSSSSCLACRSWFS